MNISLIGLRSTGKTTISRLLAKKLDRKLISINDELAKKTKLSMEKSIKKFGEKFHDIHSEIIENVSDLDDCIIDTSTLIIARNENLINLKKNGLVILLTANPKTITSRIKSTKRLPDFSLEDEYKYKQAADYAIDTSSLMPEEICDLIIHYVQAELQ